MAEEPAMDLSVAHP